jgi:replication factor C subunit 2/4
VPHTPEGLEALIFTSEGDMRQAINNLQSTYSGFGMLNEENVFKVCDQPHPKLVHAMIEHCLKSNIDPAADILTEIWDLGYSALDIITTLFRVTKNFNDIPDQIKLAFIKVLFI